MNRKLLRRAAGASLFFAVTPAWAYIDPGTGSMLVQSALAIIAAALVGGRAAWDKIKGLFTRRTNDAADREV